MLNDEKYLPIAKRIFEALLENKLTAGEDGKMHIGDICLMAGLGPDDKKNRDGSIEYYLSEPRVMDDSKGVGPVMMAYAEYLMAK